MPADNADAATRRGAIAAASELIVEAWARFSFFAANAPAAFGPYKRYADISFGPEPAHRLDVYVPEGTPPHGSRPVVVFWHGGRWRYGDKLDYRFVGAALAGLGYVAVVANYRHWPQVKMPGFIEDAARAALWSAANAGKYGGDPKRLYLMGHSAGAHLAALITLDLRYFTALGQPMPRIAGVIGLSGPYDFLPLTDADQQDMFGPPDLYSKSQPINFVRADAPPMLLIQGLADETVKPKNSRNLAAALTALRVPVTLKLYPKVSHADTVAALTLLLRGRAPTLADIQRFIEAGT